MKLYYAHVGFDLGGFSKSRDYQARISARRPSVVVSMKSEGLVH